MSEEVREDVLHAFVTGLRKGLRSVVLPAHPKDLPSALALPRDTEAILERRAFSVSYSKAKEEKDHYKADWNQKH